MSAELDTKWIKAKSVPVLTYTLAALRRLSAHPCATLTDKPWVGLPVYVVGAGPSLARNLEQLPEAARRGAIVVVNASSPAVESVGVRPDALIVRESIDCSAEVEASSARSVVLDVGCHPAIWDAAGARAHWYLPGYPRHFPLGDRLGVTTPYTGTAALTAAVRFAHHWGASSITLVGCDLAFGPAGELYHAAAPRGAAVASVSDGVAHVSQDEASAALHEASGQPPPPALLHTTEVPGWGGTGPVMTQGTWSDQIDWLSAFAAREDVDCYNATEGGASIEGWADTTLAEDISERLLYFGDHRLHALHVDEDRVEATIADQRRAASALLERAELMLAPGHPDWAAARAASPADDALMAEGLGCVDNLDADWAATHAGDKRRRVWLGWRAGARRALEALA